MWAALGSSSAGKAHGRPGMPGNHPSKFGNNVRGGVIAFPDKQSGPCS